MTTKDIAKYLFGLGVILMAIFTWTYSWILIFIILACACILVFGTKKSIVLPNGEKTDGVHL
jgi:hypothetical protein